MKKVKVINPRIISNSIVIKLKKKSRAIAVNVILAFKAQGDESRMVFLNKWER